MTSFAQTGCSEHPQGKGHCKVSTTSLGHQIEDTCKLGQGVTSPITTPGALKPAEADAGPTAEPGRG